MGRRLVRLAAVAAGFASAAAAAEPALPPLPDACRSAAPLPVDGTFPGLVLPDGGPVTLADIALPADGRALPAAPGDLLAHPVSDYADRYGGRHAHLAVTGGSGGETWWQAQLVADGHAFVRPDGLASACIAALLPVEAAARAAGRGIWAGAVPALAADAPDRARHVGRFVVVTGKVLSMGETARTVYLNFGKSYASDFTVLVRKQDLATFPEAARDLRRLEGRTIRTRGLLQAWNGGMIRVEHPAQIELLDDPAPEGG